MNCSQCEYFDAEYGDCLNPLADRFQTEAASEACAAFCPSSTPVHASDCSVHNEPAYPNGPCDCGAEKGTD